MYTVVHLSILQVLLYIQCIHMFEHQYKWEVEIVI